MPYGGSAQIGGFLARGRYGVCLRHHLLLELLGPSVLLGLLPAISRATGHVVWDHVLGLADHACLFLGQSGGEIKLRDGLTSSLSHFAECVVVLVVDRFL